MFYTLFLLLFLNEDPNIYINKLGSNHFKERVEAYNKLKNIGFPALKYLEEGFKNKDIEIRRKCEFLYNEYFIINLDEKGSFPQIFQFQYGEKIKTTYGKDFTIPKFSEITKIYMKQCELEGYNIENWGEYYFTHDVEIAKIVARQIAIKLLKEGFPKKELILFLKEKLNNEVVLPMPSSEYYYKNK